VLALPRLALDGEQPLAEDLREDLDAALPADEVVRLFHQHGPHQLRREHVVGVLGADVHVGDVSMGTSAHETDGLVIKLVDQQEIPADVAFAVIGPLAFQRVIQPFRP
jgi:hypothetical protein